MSGIDETSKASRASSSIRNAVLIAGPTASGKSKLALDIARRTGGVIVNTDSMQVYDVLNIVTARPSAADLDVAPHRLYGHVDPATGYSTGAWLRDVAALQAAGEFDRRKPIFVGGTGLYFRGLTQGFSAMPTIPEEIRTRWRYRLGEEGPERLHRTLMSADPDVAMKLQAGDGQRIVRALEVLDASGRSILDWQRENSPPLIDLHSARCLVLSIDRQVLDQRIERRLQSMLDDGALDEIEKLSALRLPSTAPAMRAIGVAEFGALLHGEIDESEALARAKIATRQYAKRQMTWFRNQFGSEWQVVDAKAAQDRLFLV